MGVIGTYRHHFSRFFGQLDDLARLDRENEDLHQKVGVLEKEAATREVKKTEADFEALNQMVSEKLRDDAGSEIAVAMKTLDFEIPRNLSYAQLHSLALGYFKKQEFEKSALILNHLFSLKEEGKFRVADNFLLSGISWFHLKNYHAAYRDVKEALASSHEADDTHRSAAVWAALIEERFGKKALSQASLLKFLEAYPHSDEASMINGTRKPASDSGPDAEEGGSNEEPDEN